MYIQIETRYYVTPYRLVRYVVHSSLELGKLLPDHRHSTLPSTLTTSFHYFQQRLILRDRSGSAAVLPSVDKTRKNQLRRPHRRSRTKPLFAPQHAIHNLQSAHW